MATFNPREALRRSLQMLPEYAALEDPAAVAAQFGLDLARVVKVDGNENPYGPSPRALEALRAVEYEPNRYGDADQKALRAAIGRYLDVPPEAVVCGAGSDEVIELIFRLFMEEGDRIVTSSPTFGMYAFNAQVAGAEVVDVPLLEQWAFDTEGLVDAALQAKATFLPSPNNPTGNPVPVGVVDALLETGNMLVLDEAYIEFSDAPSLAKRAAETPGLVVLRTFSKWGGLAGLRIGYAVLHPETAAILMQAKDPYNLNAAAEAAALASLEDVAVLDERACLLAAERERVSEALAGLGWVHPYPSQAVFLLMRLDGRSGRAVRDGLRRRGIFARYIDHPRLQDHIRISMGLPEQNDLIIQAFTDIGRKIGEETANA
ncbi:MAG: histidinol-phosphate transaminase [Dehalococcoidia bacterium]|nr:histidinol-phosphate transaminase [Dehalococcoidia bacterium]